MEITRVFINNFRSIDHVDVMLGSTTVLIGPNNVGKTAILDAIRLALTRRWGQRGTGFNESDIRLPAGTTDPSKAPPIHIQIEFQERTPHEWGNELQNALDDIIQIDPITGRGIIILDVTCGINANGAIEPRWEFFNIDRQPLTGKGARATNLQEIFHYIPVFYLKATRDADDEFSARSQFWGRLLKAMNIPEALQAVLKTNLTDLNDQLIKADPRLDTVTATLKNITKVAPIDTPGSLDLRAIALQPWDMLQKTEVIYQAHNDQPWLPLTNHGHGIQSLAVIFLFDAYVKLLLAESFRPESTAILQLEEPETHLHPQATKSVCTTILQLPGQKIVTTHSPFFVQSVPFRQLRLLRMTAAGTTIAWLRPHYTTKLPHLPDLDHIVRQHDKLLSYDQHTSTLTAACVISEKLYRQLIKAYASHPDQAAISNKLKQLKADAKHHITDDELAKLETWARRIRGEIFFARKWLIVEGQSDYLIMHTLAGQLGYAPDEYGVSIIDAQNNGSAGIFAALARALSIPWIALFDGDAAGLSYVEQIKSRDFDADELKQRCHVLASTDIEEFLVTNGLEDELRAILTRLGVEGARTITVPKVVTKLRSMKIEYAIELCNDLRNDPALVTRIPPILTNVIVQLKAVQS